MAHGEGRATVLQNTQITGVILIMTNCPKRGCWSAIKAAVICSCTTLRAAVIQEDQGQQRREECGL